MKRILAAISSAVLMLFSLAACGISANSPVQGGASSSAPAQAPVSAAEGSAQPESAPGDAGAAPADESASNILIAYFSWADNAILAEDVDAVASPSVIAPENVQQLAGWVQEETGGDLFSIRVTEPYPSDWDACLERANQERGNQARPALAERVENLEQYDTVFLGYPNWWYGVPMALLTFLEENDLSGKQVYLFCSHGTGGLANSVDIISGALPGASISDNIFDCYEEEAASSQAAIQSWVAGLGYTRSSSPASDAGSQTPDER